MSFMKLKKRGLSDLLAEQPDDNRLKIAHTKVFPGVRDSYDQTRLTISNLSTIFPDLDHSVVIKDTYYKHKGSTDKAISELERLQEAKRLHQSTSTQNKPIRADLAPHLVDERAIESEITREIKGLEQQSCMTLQSLGSNARGNIRLAKAALLQCANEDEIERVLEGLIDRVVTPTLEAKEQEANVIKAKYAIAKKACHIQSAQIEKREEEIGELKSMVKFWMREVDKSQHQKQLEPNRDVY